MHLSTWQNVATSYMASCNEEAGTPVENSAGNLEILFWIVQREGINFRIFFLAPFDGGLVQTLRFLAKSDN